MTDALATVFRGETNKIREAFAQMGIAEDYIREAYPRRRSDPKGLFLACRAPLLSGLLPEMYVAHVKEQIVRSRSKRPLYNQATEAEVLAGLLQTSLKAPLNTAGMALADELFRRVFGFWGTAANKPFAGEPTKELWPGQVEEELAAARKIITGRED